MMVRARAQIRLILLHVLQRLQGNTEEIPNDVPWSLRFFLQQLQTIEFHTEIAVYIPELTELVAILQANKPFPVDEPPFNAAAWRTESAPIVQIKKIINALYHLEQACGLIDDWYSKHQTGRGFYWNLFTNMPLTLRHEYPKLNDHVYEVAQLLTHGELGSDVLFGSLQTGPLQELLNWLQEKPYSEEFQADVMAVAYQAGNDMARPLAALSRPNWLGAILGLPDEVHALQTRVLSLATDNPPPYGETPLPAWLSTVSEWLTYLPSARSAVRFYSDLQHELQTLQGATKYVVLEKLAQLNEQWMTMMANADALEAALLLQPGFLSNPLLDRLRARHAVLSDQILNLNLGITPPEVAFPGSRCTRRRLDAAFRRHATMTLASESIDLLLDEQWATFVSLLTESTLYEVSSSQRLMDLSDALKSNLIDAFRPIQPHLAAVDIGLSNTIARALLSREAASWMDSIPFAGYFASPPDRLDALSQKLIAVTPVLKAHLEKTQATHRFYARLQQRCIETLAPLPDNATFLEHFATETQEVMTLAQTNLMAQREAQARSALVVNEVAEMRVTRTVKSPILPETIATLRTNLMAMSGRMLSPAIHRVLSAAVQDGKTIPFPEVNVYSVSTYDVRLDLNAAKKVLEQPYPLLPLKQVANALYFLEQYCSQIEQMDDRLPKIRYNQLFFNAIHYAYRAQQGLMAVGFDSYLTSTLPIVGMNEARAPWLSFEQTYWPEADRDNSIFLILNGLTLLPNQLQAGVGGLEHQAIQSIGQKNRLLSLQLQRMILNEHPIFGNVLKTRAVLELFQILVEKVEHLLGAVRDQNGNISDGVVVQHLQSMHQLAVTPLLIAMDQWEERLGLKQGLLSNPLKQALDAYYRGVLTSFALNRSHHAQLMTRFNETCLRIKAAERRKRAAQAQHAVFQTNKQRLDDLHSFVSSSWLWNFRAQQIRNGIQLDFVQHCLPILLNEPNAACRMLYLQLAIPNELPIHEDINFLYALQLDQVEHRMFVISLLEIHKAAQVGHMETQQLALELADQTIASLKTSLKQQVTTDIKTMLCVFHGHFFEEPGELYERLALEHANEIAEALFQTDEPVDSDAFQNRVNEAIQRTRAEQENSEKALLALKAVVQQMDAYIRAQHEKTWSLTHLGFENEQTLSRKRALLNEITAALNNRDALATQRLITIRAIIARDDFQPTLLAHAEYEPLTYGWWVQCLATLLKAVGLYKPMPEIIVGQFSNNTAVFFQPVAPVVQNEPEIPVVVPGAH